MTNQDRKIFSNSGEQQKSLNPLVMESQNGQHAKQRVPENAEHAGESCPAWQAARTEGQVVRRTTIFHKGI